MKRNELKSNGVWRCDRDHKGGMVWWGCMVLGNRPDGGGTPVDEEGPAGRQDLMGGGGSL